METQAASQGLQLLPEMGPLMLKSILMLAVVLAILLGVAFLLRRISGVQALSGEGVVKVQGSCHVGPKERLMLVDAQGVRLLLGVTTQSITTLHTFGPVEETENSEPSSPSFFDTLFRREIKKKGEDDA